MDLDPKFCHWMLMLFMFKARSSRRLFHAWHAFYEEKQIVEHPEFKILRRLSLTPCKLMKLTESEWIHHLLHCCNVVEIRHKVQKNVTTRHSCRHHQNSWMSQKFWVLQALQQRLPSSKFSFPKPWQKPFRRPTVHVSLFHRFPIALSAL